MKKEVIIEENDAQNEVSFDMFSDKSAFEHVLDLRNATVIECIEQYVNTRSKNSKKSMRQYRHVIMHIDNIQKESNIVLYPLVICDIFWTRFHKYLYNKGLAGSTINNICCKLSAVLKWSSKYGAKISPSLDECYTDDYSAKPKIALTQDEVSRITYFDINSCPCRPQLKRTLEMVRDQFVISCFLGQRYSDVSRLNPDNFNGDVFSIVQQKTGNKAVVDLNKMAAYPSVVINILKKYDYKAPYPRNITQYNRHLHTLFMFAGFTEDIVHQYKCNGKIHNVTYKKYELISSHTARRTMITTAVSRGIHNEQVRRASGHKSEAAFSRYVCWNDEN